MIVIYSILAFLATVYLVISAIAFFNHYDHFSTYRKVYKILPELEFKTNRNRDEIICGNFVYDIDCKHFELDDDVFIYDGVYELFDLYSWYYRVKFEKWFAENIDIDELPI